MLVAAGTALLGAVACESETSVIPPYGIPPRPPMQDGSADAIDAGREKTAADANAPICLGESEKINVGQRREPWRTPRGE